MVLHDEHVNDWNNDRVLRAAFQERLDIEASKRFIKPNDALLLNDEEKWRQTEFAAGWDVSLMLDEMRKDGIEEKDERLTVAKGQLTPQPFTMHGAPSPNNLPGLDFTPSPEFQHRQIDVHAPPAADNKPLQRQPAQELVILEAARKLGFAPLKLPRNKPGISGAKAAIRAEVTKNQKDLFTGATVFDKAWERMTAGGVIAFEA